MDHALFHIQLSDSSTVTSVTLMVVHLRPGGAGGQNQFVTGPDGNTPMLQNLPPTGSLGEGFLKMSQ